MQAPAYTMNVNYGVPFAIGQTGQLCHDVDQDAFDTRVLLRAQVRSGDYFATLATRIDELSVQIGSADDATNYELQRLVGDLLYLQHHYKIIEK